MKRREFLKLSGGMCLLPFSSCTELSRELPADIKITRVVGFDLHCPRNKIAGKNAVKGVHGSGARDQMIRVYTNAGIDGIGHCRGNEKAVAQILGKSLKKLYDIERCKMTGALGAGRWHYGTWQVKFSANRHISCSEAKAVKRCLFMTAQSTLPTYCHNIKTIGGTDSVKKSTWELRWVIARSRSKSAEVLSGCRGMPDTHGTKKCLR